MRSLPWIIVALLLGAASVHASNQGIPITPDEAGQFEYADDFTTPRLFRDAFLNNFSTDCWQTGSITNTGPNRNRTVTYRFYADRVIVQATVEVQQQANGRNLGGRNLLYLSGNGLDWTLVATSAEQEADRNGWQREPLTAGPQQTTEFAVSTELWVRIVLDNFCGLQTNTSNVVSHLQIGFELGKQPGAASDPQAARRAAWGQLRQQADWRNIALDCYDPVGRRAPHYYEDSDGWLQPPGANPHLGPHETEGFPVRRADLSGKRSPLSLATFVKLPGSAGSLMARISVRCSKESSRKMNVLWDGKLLDTFDVASYFDTDGAFFVQIPGNQRPGIHELRLAGTDSGAMLVREISLAGPGQLAWVEKPALPAGGKLRVLSAYYMPDVAPPLASQAVEGRHKTQEVGLIITGMQRLYKEHSDFGAMRVIVRNNSDVPVRISDLQLNGKPVEDSYVDFVASDWDGPGVVWYRIRPRLLAPHQCAEIYIRFRHRPAG
ncbi:MAG: hypothetical protein KAW89_10485, partial [Armatimonadetes bacterium]|nr:hypothetical protein [Armatimonadota bacterium]